MTSLRFERADFGDPRLADFLAAHLADLEPTAPPESRHALDLSQLDTSSVRMWVGWAEGALVVTGALKDLGEGTEEVKSMRTAPRWRGRGAGRAVLHHLLADARSRQVRRLVLDTGSMDFFIPARTLYLSEGFEACAPYGHFVEDPNTVYMERRLA